MDSALLGGETGWRLPWLRCETGATWLDLLATTSKAYGPEPIERMVDVAWLRSWLAVEDLLPQIEPAEADLGRARELRAGLRSIALAVLGDAPWPAGGIELLNGFLAEYRPLAARLSASGDLSVGRPATTVEALGRIARQAVEQLTGPVRAELHRCADQECGLLFLDAGGRRRWCSAEVCGVRHRVRTHRERQKVQP